MIAPYYAILYMKLDRVAMRHGYALALHGSMQRDLDLIAIPWTEDADDPEDLLMAIEKFIKSGTDKNIKRRIPHGEKKPHGRIAYSFHLGYSGRYLDVSVMPRITEIQ